MKIVVFTFKDAPQERKDNVDLLVDELSADVFEGGPRTCENLINMCNEYKGEDILMIEDDVEICTDFLSKITAVINTYKNRIINFHYNREMKIDEYDIIDDLGIYELSCSSYCYNQCVYLPKKYIKRIIDKQYMFAKYLAYTDRNAHAVVMSRIFGNDKFLVVKPSLVKHLSFSSTIGNEENQTIDFYDDVA